MKMIVYKIIVCAGLIVLFGCSSTVKFKPRDCYAPPEPKLLPVEVVNGAISGESKDNVMINWARVWAYLDEVKAKCGIKDYEDLARHFGTTEEVILAIEEKAKKQIIVKKYKGK